MSSVPVSAPRCVACQSELATTPLVEATFEFEHAGVPKSWTYRLLSCPTCGMGRLFPNPPENALTAMYSTGYDAYDGDADGAATSASRRLKLLVAELNAAALRSKQLPQQRLLAALTRVLELAGGRTVPLTASVPLALPHEAAILDFGCGAGFWLMAMKHHGYSNLHAFDIGQPALERLSALGITCYADDPARLPDHTFDCIRLEHVLEHLVSPVESLALLRSKLTRRGTISLTVPNFGSQSARQRGRDWRALKLPHHLSHFTVSSLQRIARMAGLQVARSRFLPISELALAKPSNRLERLTWRARRHGYHALAYDSPSADYVSLELEQP